MKRLKYFAAAVLVVAIFPLPVLAADGDGLEKPPIPASNPGSWVNVNDYPSSALREEISGLVRFALTIDTEGGVAACEVTESSGSEVLDQTACSLMVERARFEPARDATGKATTGTWQSAVRWEIPQNVNPGMPAPSDTVFVYTVEKDGSVSSCSVTFNGQEGRIMDACGPPGGFAPSFNKEGNPVRIRMTTRAVTTIEELPDEE